jgi:hypothetical protein
VYKGTNILGGAAVFFVLFFARHGKGPLSLRDTPRHETTNDSMKERCITEYIGDSTICLIVHITISYYGAFAGLA